MKKIVRCGTFETNSSSSHSLVVTKSSDVFTPEEIRENFWVDKDRLIWMGSYRLDFGRNPNAPLVSFADKLRYLIATYCNSNPEKIDELLSIVQKYVPEVKGFKFDLTYNGNRCYYGSIDHQSMGIVRSYIEKHNLSLEEFLINKKYIIILDGDEYDMWGTMKESGLVNLDFIEEEYGEN